jgi:hypothetical protein
MDPFERDRLDRLNRDAERARTPDDPQPPVDPGDSRPLVVMIFASLAATVMVLGIMWLNNTRHEGATAAVAEQTQR